VDGPLEMADCVALYERVMGLRPGDGSLNARLLTALQDNSGLVVGAYLGEALVGFTYSFLARERGADGQAGRLYQYSQLAVVAHERQGLGIGRLLKLGQRDRCLAEGTTLIRWAYDPMQTRNAHFNLDVLGAVVDAVKPAMYGTSGFGAAAGESTDRFIVSWHLDAPARPALPAPVAPTGGWSVGQVYDDGEDRIVVLPDDWHRLRAQAGPGHAARLRGNLTDTFARLLADRTAVSCVRLPGGLAAYRFIPRAAASGTASRP
jgi:predicted GNAT superfamily acetyltransferase